MPKSEALGQGLGSATQGQADLCHFHTPRCGRLLGLSQAEFLTRLKARTAQPSELGQCSHCKPSVTGRRPFSPEVLLVTSLSQRHTTAKYQHGMTLKLHLRTDLRSVTPY